MPTWTGDHSIVVNAAPESIWNVLRDVENWPRWDADIAWARLNTPLRPGATGVLKPTGGPKTQFTVTRADPGRRLTDVSRLPLTRVEFDHVLEPSGSGTRLTHKITMSGPLAGLFGRVIGRKLQAGLPTAMNALAEHAAR